MSAAQLTQGALESFRVADGTERNGMECVRICDGVCIWGVQANGASDRFIQMEDMQTEQKSIYDPTSSNEVPSESPDPYQSSLTTPMLPSSSSYPIHKSKQLPCHECFSLSLSLSSHPHNLT